MSADPTATAEFQGREDVVSLDELTMLARKHSRRAVERLAELMNCDGRQAMVAAVASKAIVQLAFPDLDDDKVNKLVEAKFKALVVEARRQLETRQRTIDVAPDEPAK